MLDAARRAELSRLSRPYLRQAREAKGYYQNELSQLIGRSHNYMQRLETHYVDCPPLDVAYRLSVILERPMRELFPEVFYDADEALNEALGAREAAD